MIVTELSWPRMSFDFLKKMHFFIGKNQVFIIIKLQPFMDFLLSSEACISNDVTHKTSVR